MNPLIWSGFSNWANYTVSILANGFVHADVVVSGAGEITLTKEVQRIIVGSPYISEVETMPIEAGGNFGSAQGSVKRINRAVIRFFKTYGAKYGPDATHLKSIDFRAGSAGMNDPLVLFTGDKVEAFDSGSDRLVKVHIRQTQPLPCNILGIILRGSTND